MIATDEDSLICDFAETYGIFDFRSLPVKLVATLASGLRPESRIKMRISKMNVTMDTLLIASAVDRLSILAWQNTEDGRKNRRKPKSIAEQMLRIEKENDIVAFESGQDYEDYMNTHFGRREEG